MSARTPAPVPAAPAGPAAASTPVAAADVAVTRQAPSGPPSRAKVILAFAAVYVIWGSTYLAIRFAIQTIPPGLMAGTRFVIAGAILYAWARLGGAPRPTRANWRAATIVGALLLLGGNGAVVWAERTVPSGLAALLAATTPIFMVLIDWLHHGGERPTLLRIAGLVLGLVGILVLVNPGSGGGSAVDPIGALMLLGGSVAWSLGSLYTRHAEMPASPLMATGIEMLAGGVLLLLAGAATGELRHFSLAAVTASSAIGLAYLITFGAIIGFTAYIWLLQVASPARVATYAYVNPVVAVILGWALAGEPITARTLVAAAIIIGSVVMISVGRGDRSGRH